MLRNRKQVIQLCETLCFILLVERYCIRDTVPVRRQVESVPGTLYCAIGGGVLQYLGYGNGSQVEESWVTVAG